MNRCSAIISIGMDVTDGNSERIGGIIGLGRKRQLQQRPHHLLHLRFFRPAIAGDCRLHFQRRIFIHGHIGFSRSNYGGPPDMPEEAVT